MKGQLIRHLLPVNCPFFWSKALAFGFLYGSGSPRSTRCRRRVPLENAAVWLPRTWCHSSPGPIQALSRTLHKATFLVEAVVVLAGRMGSCGGHNLFCGYIALQSVCTPTYRKGINTLQSIYTHTHTALAPQHAACMGPRV